MPTATTTSNASSSTSQRLPRHIRRHGPPPPAPPPPPSASRVGAGIGVDLIAATQRAWPDDGPNYSVNVRSAMPQEGWDGMLEEISKRARQRGRVGTSCQRADCSKLENESTRGTFKRCGGCEQVMYCGSECQRKDWPTHKAVCNNVLPKDALMRLARYAMANICLTTLLKNYARGVLDLDHDPQAGLKNTVVVTYTTVYHAPSRANIFQLSRVECVPTPETLSSTVPEVREKVTDKDRLWVQFELKPDAPGVNTSYRTFERVEKWWLTLPDTYAGESVRYLTGYNKVVREDINNNFKLRLHVV